MMKFNEKYQSTDFLQFLQGFLPEDFLEREEDIVINKERYKVITDATVLGFCSSLDLYVLEMDHSREKDPRVAITTDAFKILADNWIHRALVVFRNKDTENYRFSYLTITLDQNDKDKVVKKYSNARRYSFYLGVSAKVKTAENFLIKKGRIKNYEDLLDRFNVEVVTKEFYQSYKKLFDNLLNHLKSDKAFSAFAGKHGLRLEIFTKKLLGQIVFLYFLQKKGWLGAPKNEHISKGDGKFLRNLFSKCRENNSNFFNEYLEVLFYDCLNSLPTMAGSFYREKFDCQIPFLNGGLFEPINDYRWQDEFINIPNEIFSNVENSGILDIFDLYNFTIDENTPDDQEVSVDPEMLGKVFENLLEDNIRKGQGAFYTPREIVHYMCQESLINYLSSNSKVREEKVRRLIKKDGIFTDEELQNIDDVKELEKAADTNIFLDKNEAKILNELLKNIKVVDPACGSGAFLVGMLHEIVYARSYLYGWFLDVSKNMEYILKKETIQNCLYGVDIDPGAIDIAKLRFWLSVIVDENIEDIEPLPNLDYKLMQGNSLLEDLVIGDSIIQFKFDGSKKVDRRTKEQLKMFESNGIQGKLILDESETLAEKLEKYHTQYFNITDPGKKKLLKKKIDNIEDELIQSKCQEEISHAEAFISSNLGDSKKILKGTEKILAVTNVLNKWSKDHLRPFFPWKLHFSEVFYKDNSGFDIVIGNPPYVGEKGNKETFRPIAESSLGKRFYQGKMDLFYFFFHIALDYLSEGGVMAYITTNYYITATGAVKLRKDIHDRSSILMLLNFGELKIFESALGQHNMITMLIKGKNDIKANTLTTHKKGYLGVEAINLIINGSDPDTDYYEMSQKELYSGNNIKLTSGGLDDILDKIAKNIHLKEIANVNAGIQTSADKFTEEHHKNYPQILAKKGDGIFIFPLGQLKKIIKDEGLIKPWFKNSDVTKWITNNTNKSELLLSNFIANREQEPDVIDYLARFKEILINRSQPEHMLDWWDLHQIRMKDKNKTGEIKKMIFDGPKIVNKSLQRYNDFAYNDIPWYAPSGAMGGIFYITMKEDSNISLKYLLGILNSKPIYVWLYNRGKRKGEMLALSGTPLSEIPIPKLTTQNKKQVQKIDNLVDQILTLKKQNKDADTKNLESQIDQLVYKLYDLTAEEIKIVERN